MRISVVIPAAGNGERLGLGPKAYLELKGRPLVAWVCERAEVFADEIIIAAPAGGEQQINDACPNAKIIEGRATRQDTVARLTEAATGDYILIQDAARPFASTELMRAVCEAALPTGVAGAFLKPDIPVARLDDGLVTHAFDKDAVGIFQAPQAFRRDLLMDLHERASTEGWAAQSTLQLALLAGHAVRAVPGEKLNLKVTTPEDWVLARAIADYFL